MVVERQRAGREPVVRAGLKMLDELGFDGLTLGAIARELNVRAPTLYWRFSSKQDLVDEMATRVVADWLQAPALTDRGQGWRDWVMSFATSFRIALKAHRDGARLVAGTHMKDNVLLQPLEDALTLFSSAGIAVPDAVLCIKTIYDFVIGFTIEEQAIEPLGERDPRYSLEDRPARVGGGSFPLSIEAGPYLLDNFEKRFADGICGFFQQPICAICTRCRTRSWTSTKLQLVIEQSNFLFMFDSHTF
ncbi:MAG: TetR family transcriptional regulator [Cytophagaceae bacterium]|nr:MAG: TetR family transcriptional regulator [Cytophagaceae bacterium]